MPVCPAGLNNMPPMRAASRLASALACLFAAALLVAGCGGDSGSTDSTGGSGASAESRPAPPKSDFPSPEGRTLREVLKAADGPSELVVSPAAHGLLQGREPLPVRRLRTRPHPGAGCRSRPLLRQGADAEAGRQVEVGQQRPGRESRGPGAGRSPRSGPFPASIESLATKPAFRAQTTVDDPDAASVVYSTEVDFPSNGEWRVAALVKEGGEIKGTLLPQRRRSASSAASRRPGQKAPKIHTPTPADVGGDLAKITTRIPPDTQNRVDYADALGKEPIVLLFATPQFCQSRVCGPVVDVAEQVKQEDGDKAAFIHMEIYNDNDPSKGVRPQVRAFNLPSEPWLFAINRQGVVSSVVEGAFGLERMTAAVKKAVAE